MTILLVVLYLSPPPLHTHTHCIARPACSHPPSPLFSLHDLTCPHLSTPDVHTQVRTSRWPYRPHGSQRRGPGPADASRAQVRGVTGQAGDHTAGVKGGGGKCGGECGRGECGINWPLYVVIMWWWCHLLSPSYIQEERLGSALRCVVATCPMMVLTAAPPLHAQQEELLGSALRWLPPPPEKEARNSKGRGLRRQKGGREQGSTRLHSCTTPTQEPRTVHPGRPPHVPYRPLLSFLLRRT